MPAISPPPKSFSAAPVLRDSSFLNWALENMLTLHILNGIGFLHGCVMCP